MHRSALRAMLPIDLEGHLPGSSVVPAPRPPLHLSLPSVRMSGEITPGGIDSRRGICG